MGERKVVIYLDSVIALEVPYVAYSGSTVANFLTGSKQRMVLEVKS